MLTPDEVKKVRGDAVSVLGSVKLPMQRAELIKILRTPPRSTALSNGYQVILTTDVLRKNIRYLHLSVKNLAGETDPADSETIAKDILGEGYSVMGNNLRKDVFHFFKIERINGSPQ